MEHHMRGTGYLGERKDTGLSFTRSATLTKGSGSETRPVGMESTRAHLTEASIKDSGRMMCRRVMEWRSGEKIRVNMKVSLSKGLSKVLVCKYGLMAPITKAIGGLI